MSLKCIWFQQALNQNVLVKSDTVWLFFYTRSTKSMVKNTFLDFFPVCFKCFLCICGIKNITFDFIDYNGSLFHTCSVFNRQTSTVITKVALWHFKFIKVAHGRQKVCGSSSDHYYIVSKHRWQSSPRTRVFLAALNLCQSQHWCQTPPPLFYWGVCMRIVLWNRYPLVLGGLSPPALLLHWSISRPYYCRCSSSAAPVCYCCFCSLLRVMWDCT